jgi:glycosyltransferase involved in cell wall biosynthesis
MTQLTTLIPTCRATPAHVDAAIAPISQCRILYLDHTAKLGGGEIALFNLVLHLGPAYRPVVLLFSEGPLAEKLLRAGIETHILPLDRSVTETCKDSLGLATLFRIFSVFRVFAFIFRLRQFIRENDFDIVHTNSLKADLIGGIAARLAGVPVIWHVRDRIADDYLPPVVAKVFRRLARVIPQHVIANSLATLKTLQLKSYQNTHAVPSGLTLAQRFHVVHDGMQRTALVRDSAEDSNCTLKVGLVGRITRWKGQHIFIEAASIVRRDFPHARFQIIGGALFNETEYENEIRDLVGLHGLEDVIEFTGHRNDVPKLIAELDLLVHASITGEPFGQVIIEAMAAAKPVVATNGGGVPEIVLDGVTGLLVPMGDPIAMADAIIRFLSDPDFRQYAGQLGRERLLNHFTIHHTVQKIHHVYEAITPIQRQSA